MTKETSWAIRGLDENDLVVLENLGGKNCSPLFASLQEKVRKFRSGQLADSPVPRLRFTREEIEAIEHVVHASMVGHARAFAVPVSTRNEDSDRKAIDCFRLWGKIRNAVIDMENG